MKSTRHSAARESGQIFGVLIVLVLVIGGGFWWLYNYRNTMRNEGRAFGRHVIERLVLNHDANFLDASLGPQAKLDIPASSRFDLISKLQQLGAPVGPLNVQGDVQFQSQFFEPRGNFTAVLLSHRRHAPGTVLFASGQSLANRFHRPEYRRGAAMMSILPVDFVSSAADQANPGKFATSFRAIRGGRAARAWLGT